MQAIQTTSSTNSTIDILDISYVGNETLDCNVGVTGLTDTVSMVWRPLRMGLLVHPWSQIMLGSVVMIVYRELALLTVPRRLPKN